MKCQASDCYAAVSGHTSDYCEMHKGHGTFAFSYHEWDRDRWNDRLELLHNMWEQEQSEEQRKRVIADLLIHAHDLSEK
mgnify:CR=1 FL=1